MEPQQPLTLDESIKQVMQTLPPAIRHYLGQGLYSGVANRLMTKYGLHVDQGGILEREIMLLLMGIENPDEFTESLVTEANLDEQTTNRIVQDVNELIFIPLRDQMRNAAPIVSAPPKPISPPPLPPPPRPVVVPPPVPPVPPTPQPPKRIDFPTPVQPQAVTPEPPVRPLRSVNLFATPEWKPPSVSDYSPDLPKGTFAPPLQSPRYPNQENLSDYIRRPVSTPLNTGYKPPAPRYSPPPRPIVKATPPASTAPAPGLPTVNIQKPLGSDRQLEDHEEPHIEFNRVQAPSTSRTAPPPSNLPGTFPTPPVAPAPTFPRPSAPPQVVTPSAPVPPAPKPYTVDPYREPIDEAGSV